AAFEQVSPEVGVLDEAALDAAMADDADQTLSLIADLTAATDPALRRLARELARRIFLDVARTGRATRRAVGTIRRQRYRPDGGDLDIDASIDALVVAQHGADVDELRISGWQRPDLGVCLVVDRSGSMGGQPLATAAIAAAAIVQRARGDYSVAAFSNDVLLVATQHGGRSADQVVDDLLSLRGYGSTDLAAALNAASEQLATSRAARRVAVLLSDCRANVDGDHVAAAECLEELVIIAPASDADEAASYARTVGARLATISGPAELPGVLEELLA
ncbi:MAG TPA: VWA domain-containing protein, partial [Ilumatobacteraceae bacterium]|nr:VWA domain-containing protein [Ilumatobacteraceae bacterium]